MTERFLEWRRLDREHLVDWLSHGSFDQSKVPQRIEDVSHIRGLPREGLIGAFVRESPDSKARIASLYIDGSAARDFFAWVSTYLPALCPLTQVVRVQPVEDLGLFKDASNHSGSLNYSGAWAGAIAGECLAQLGEQPSPGSATLSAAAATFTLPIARFQALWSHSAEYSALLERLHLAIGKPDGRDRRLAIQQLRSAWSVLRALERDSYKTVLQGSERAIVEVCHAIAGSSTPGTEVAQLLAPSVSAIAELKQLNDMTAEQRLAVFDRIMDSYLTPSSKDESGDLRTFAVSVAAWAVGLGEAKHINLLWPAAETSPMLLVWFCLLVGLHPQASRSEEFSGFFRLIERELQYSFAPSDPPRADIGLLEYVAYQIPQFGGLLDKQRRAQARSISVEIYPGVVFSRSFGAESTRSRQPTRKEGREISLERMADLEQVLAMLWKIRNDIVHGGHSVTDTRGESRRPSDLFPNDSRGGVPTKPKKRRGGDDRD